MKLVYKSALYKVSSVLRYFLLKLFYWRKVSIKEMSMIGRRCGIYLLGQGRLSGAGRMIVGDDVMLYAKGELKIGKSFGINNFSRIVAHQSIAIGDNVTIGQMVSILDHDHHFDIKDENLELSGYDSTPISIGNNVWIGDKSTILRGVSVGNNVVVGANTLVNKDVPDNCVIGGAPFKILKTLA